MTAFDSDRLETGPAQSSYDLLPCNSRESRHLAIFTR